MGNLLLVILATVVWIDGWAFCKTGQWWLVLHAGLITYAIMVLGVKERI